MKSDRRRARELALQTLYAYELQYRADGRKYENIEEVIKNNLSRRPTKEKVSEYAAELVRRTAGNVDELDEMIREHSANWDVDRMATMDRIIIHLAMTEMKFSDDVPQKVAINEALEVAKDYSTDESIPFINGILDSISRQWFPEDDNGDT